MRPEKLYLTDIVEAADATEDVPALRRQIAHILATEYASE